MFPALTSSVSFVQSLTTVLGKIGEVSTTTCKELISFLKEKTTVSFVVLLYSGSACKSSDRTRGQETGLDGQETDIRS
jgi:hypothetical protein